MFGWIKRLFKRPKNEAVIYEKKSRKEWRQDCLPETGAVFKTPPPPPPKAAAHVEKPVAPQRFRSPAENEAVRATWQVQSAHIQQRPATTYSHGPHTYSMGVAHTHDARRHDDSLVMSAMLIQAVAHDSFCASRPEPEPDRSYCSPSSYDSGSSYDSSSSCDSASSSSSCD